MRTLTVVVAALALVGPPALASSEEAEHREHDAHVHGVATMNLAVGDHEVAVELETPAMNILGFEHPPRKEADHQAVKDAVASLQRGEEWLILTPAAGCRLETARVESALLDSAEHEEQEEHGDHEEHEDEHAHDENHDDTHSEFHVSYVFYCDNPGELNAVQVNWFEGFPGMEKIELQAVTESRQIGGELTPDQTVIELKE